MKICFKCKTEKPITEFYRHAGMSDGRLGKCISCCKIDVVTHRAKNLERIQDYDRKRSSQPHRVAARSSYQNKSRIIDKLKYAARTAVSNALRDGHLVRLPCWCGDTKTQAHHHDYTKPLDVTWLCAKHHHAKHRKYDYEELINGTAH